MSKITCSLRAWSLLLGIAAALLMAPQPARAAANKITVTKNQDLDFGSFAVMSSCSGCTVTIPASGSRTTSAGISPFTNNVGIAAKFSISCNNPSCSFTVSTPAPATIVAGSVTMTVTYSVTRTSTSTPSTVTVAGVLTIPGPGATAGTYPTSFTVLTSP